MRRWRDAQKKKLDREIEAIDNYVGQAIMQQKEYESESGKDFQYEPNLTGQTAKKVAIHLKKLDEYEKKYKEFK